MSDIRFSSVRKVYDNGVVALESFSLDIPSPRLVVLVGPSGCGKTTLLRLIAGLEKPTSGTITLGDARLDTLDPRQRDVAMVFQSYALYPHMTVRENLSFGLRIRRAPKLDIERRVEAVAQSLDVAHLLDRRPSQLSGGQRQRVALGRAIIREPKVFLFDEPLSNLDARLRDEMRYLIRRLYKRLGTTTIYVTHDQVEAMTIGEMLVVLKEGRVHQVGTPDECYRHPADTFVAAFLGSPPMNLLEARLHAADRALVLRSGGRIAISDGTAARLASEGPWTIGIRPEAFRPVGHLPDDGGRIRGRTILRELLGHEVLTHVALGDDEIVVRGRHAVAEDTDAEIELAVGEADVHFFSRETGRRVDVGPGPAARNG